MATSTIVINWIHGSADTVIEAGFEQDFRATSAFLKRLVIKVPARKIGHSRLRNHRHIADFPVRSRMPGLEQSVWKVERLQCEPVIPLERLGSGYNCTPPNSPPSAASSLQLRHASRTRWQPPQPAVSGWRAAYPEASSFRYGAFHQRRAAGSVALGVKISNAVQSDRAGAGCKLVSLFGP